MGPVRGPNTYLGKLLVFYLHFVCIYSIFLSFLDIFSLSSINMVRSRKSKAKKNTQRRVVSSVASTSSAPVPRLRQRNDCVVIKHSELVVGAVPSDSAFAPSTVLLQPGMTDSFPWLGTIANSWERYRFRKLRARFVSAAASVRDGTIMLAFDSDANDALPPTEEAMASYQGTKQTNIFNSLSIDLMPMIKDTEPVHRYTSRISHGDEHFFSVGRVLYAASGDTLSNVGRIYMDYEIELYVPQIPTDSINDTLTFLTDTTSFANPAVPGTSVDQGVIKLIPQATVQQMQEFGVQMGDDGGSIVFNKPGEYRVTTTPNAVNNASGYKGEIGYGVGGVVSNFLNFFGNAQEIVNIPIEKVFRYTSEVIGGGGLNPITNLFSVCPNGQAYNIDAGTPLYLTKM
jgi:hypothetical protein